MTLKQFYSQIMGKDRWGDRLLFWGNFWGGALRRNLIIIVYLFLFEILFGIITGCVIFLCRLIYLFPWSVGITTLRAAAALNNEACCRRCGGNPSNPPYRLSQRPVHLQFLIGETLLLLLLLSYSIFSRHFCMFLHCYLGIRKQRHGRTIL